MYSSQLPPNKRNTWLRAIDSSTSDFNRAHGELAGGSGPDYSSNAPVVEPVLLEYWRILVRRRTTVIVVTLASVALAVLLSFTMTPLYKAETRISVGKEGPEIWNSKDNGYSGFEESEYSMELDAQVKILTSDTLVLQTLRELHLLKSVPPAIEGTVVSELPVATKEELAMLSMYKASLQVTRIPHTSLFEIRCSNRDAGLAARFLNQLVQVYIEQNFETKYESAHQVATWLSNKLNDLKGVIEKSQTKLAAFQREAGLLGTDATQNIITQKLDDLNRELTSAQEDRMQKEALYRASIQSGAELVPGVSDNPVIKQLKEEQAQLANSYAQAATRLGSAHPKILELGNQLQQIDAALKTEFNKIAERNKTAYLIAEQRENMLRAALDQQKQAANQLNERAMEYEILKHDVQSSQQLYDNLSERLKEAGLSAGLRSGNVRIVDRASRPFAPAVPDIPLNLSLGLVFGFMAGGTLAFMRDRFDTRLRTAHQVEMTSALPLIGVVPRIHSARQSGTELMESYRALRVSLLAASQEVPQVIMVTSALPFEGKTTTSINCAIVLAQRDKPVLLVDADLMVPRVHKVLRLPVSPGLGTILDETGSGDDTEAIVSYSRVPGLFVLPAGAEDEERHHFLDSAIMKAKIAAWRLRFAHVIIDTPPVLCASDAMEVSTEADSVLLTAFAGKTPRAALLRARDLLLSVNAKLTGIVVNGVDRRSEDFPYGYYGYKRDAALARHEVANDAEIKTTLR